MTGSDAGPRKALVAYGSETGNAQDAAEELGRLARRLHFAVIVVPLDAVSLGMLREYGLVIISISTTGQGDLPRNAQIFKKRLLRKSLPPTLLSLVQFGIFGLGDSSYPKFNFAGLKLSKRLVQLGAEELLPLAEADEQHPEGGDSIFTPWAKTLQDRLLELYPLDASKQVLSATELLQPSWLLATARDVQEADIPPEKSSLHLTTSESKGTVRLNVRVTTNQRITPPDHWQDVRHLHFSSQAKVTYVPGDILEVPPKNNSQDLLRVLEMMGWSEVADFKIGFTRNPDCSMAPITSAPALHPYENTISMTLRRVLTECIDLNAIPKRSFFRLIAHFTKDDLQKERLEEFANPEYTDELFDYTTRPRRSILEVLQEFHTVKIPWEWLFEVFPPLRPRQFSIASGGELKTNDQGFARFELLVAIVKYRTVIRKVRRGVCTRYLEDLEPGASLEVSLIRGSLGIPESHAQAPLIMVGPGTGIAPLRALIWEKRMWQYASWNGPPLQNGSTNDVSPQAGGNALFFGCRSKGSDFFFREEWDKLQAEIPLEVHVAFSRDQQQKCYVQDVLRENRSLVLDMLYHRSGYVIVCGSSGKMPQAVRSALADIFEKGLACSRDEAEAYLALMEKSGRYKQETW